MLVEHYQQLIIELIKFGTASMVALAAIIKIYKDHQKKKELRNEAEAAKTETKEVKEEIATLTEALQFDKWITLRDWGPISADLVKLLSETRVDRFLILIAFNGLSNPRYTSAVYQFRLGPQTPYQYAYFELDTDYIRRIHESMANKYIHFKVDEIPDSAIKSVYNLEGVRESLWFFIDKNVRSDNKAEIIYCSFSTHSNESIRENTITQCRLIVNQIKEAIKRNRESN